MFQRVLVATNLSDGLYRFGKFLSQLAASGIKQVVFLHAVPLWEERGVPRVDADKVAIAEKRLSGSLQDIPADLEVKIEVLSGRPVDLIQNVVNQYQIDVIVLGTPSRSLLDEKLFGSTATSLAQHVQIPMLVLRPQLISTYTEEELALRCQHLFRYLLIPYDGSDTARSLVQYIQQHSPGRHPESLQACMLCWVLDTPGRRELHSETQKQEAQNILTQIQEELKQTGLEVTTQIRQGSPVAEIQDVALDFDISAIAVSSSHFGKLWELSIPSFTGEILRRSWHPVLFIPPQNPSR